MTLEEAHMLREPFPPASIGLLPKPTKKENPKGHCDVCGGWHGLPAIHLDYVGHAAVTDRLLKADPGWTWEPMAVEPDGAPRFVNDGGTLGLWIKLTVCGVTRPGYGDGASPKECIGDALRNAAMRFGVALDLWTKQDLEGSAGEPSADVAQSVRGKPASPADALDWPTLEAELLAAADVLGALDATREALARHEGDTLWATRMLATANHRIKEKREAEESFFQPPAGAQGGSDA